MIADATPILVAIAGGGLVAGLGGAYAAFRKAPAESAQVLVSAAQDVVVIQKGALGELQASLADCHKKIDELQRTARELPELRTEVDRLRAQNGVLMGENRRLRERIAHLEAATGNGPSIEEGGTT